MQGWVRIHRKLKEKGYYKKSQYVHLWVHIILSANHKQNEFMWNGELIIVKDGQLITGRKQLSEETGIPETTVERILDFLEKERQIGQQKTNKFRLITVINWKNHQSDGQQADNKRTTDGQQADTNKNDKKEKNEKEVNTSDVNVAGKSDIDKVMEVFYRINPTLNWGNKTSRKAAGDLIKKFGLDGTIKMAESVVGIQGKPYAPVATNPYHLKEKLAQFKIYFDSEKNKKNSKPSVAFIS